MDTTKKDTKLETLRQLEDMVKQHVTDMGTVMDDYDGGQAEAYRNALIPKARGEAEKIIQEAEGYKREVVARSQGDAERFVSVYNSYKLAKDVTVKRIYLETLEEVLKNSNKIIIDESAGTGVVPYLPLPEIDKRRDKIEPDLSLDQELNNEDDSISSESESEKQ